MENCNSEKLSMWTSTNNTFCKIWKTATLKKICTSGGTDICRYNLSNDNQTNYFMFKVYMYILTDPFISAIIGTFSNMWR